MADASQNYVNRLYAIDDTKWWPVFAPVQCNFFAMQPNAPILMRTDPDNQYSEKPIAAGVQEYTTAPWPDPTSYGYRFPAGSTMFYVRSASGPAMVQISFVT